MARKDKPYLPLYVQDFLTDERLNECSAKATGVYIKIMCVMHKSEEYGTILLKQKDKQTDNQIKNFCLKFARHIGYDLATIIDGVNELISEKVLQIEGDILFQKRMRDDGRLSLIRSCIGSEGGKSTQRKNKIAKANNKPNTKPKIESNSDIDNDIIINNALNKVKTVIKGLGEIEIEVFDGCEKWAYNALIEFVTNSQKEFELLVITRYEIKTTENFKLLLQDFINRIQTSGEYQHTPQLKKYFTNWVNDKNGKLEGYIKSLKTKDNKIQMVL